MKRKNKCDFCLVYCKGLVYYMKIFFIINKGKSKAIKNAQNAILILRNLGCECVVEKSVFEFFKEYVISEDIDNIYKYDFIIAVGGDGTILAASEYAAKYDMPILGINSGHMGFLCGLECHDLQKLEKILKNQYNEKKRMLLEVEYDNKKHIAVNDVVFVKPVLGSLIDLKVFESGNFVIEYRADSVLFSTPTGSTAYALANGGPVSDPNLDFISMSPICAHSLAARTYLFSNDAELAVQIGNRNKSKTHILIDGVELDLLENGSQVKIRKSDRKLRLVYLEDIPFFDLVRKKFLPN